ncbi:PREDICTED: transcription factor HES-5-like [Nanorana parkeri]|uniref:transcription factor HES-5-like n=1 Tax=Nanorana parkeri TaxID=125878 RepID=UPI0008544D1D|nr:PREDICTED: transcription factor HES-5-like [Nanorana parkeri]
MAVNAATCLISQEYAEDKLTTKEKNKIRKPIVEKMRRDRINSSINHLRKILEQEFQLLQPDSKPEKADVLEIAVQFLRQQMCTDSHGGKPFARIDYQEYRQGYSKCLHETLSYLSIHRFAEEAQIKLLNHFHQLETPRDLSHPRVSSQSSGQQAKHQPLSGSIKPLWRPW